jgi:hypothetical protein
MATLARADLEHLLQSRKLDVTLTTSFARASPELAGAPTGIPVLDTQLGGGLPRGQVSEVVGPASSGRSWIMATAVAAATQRGELVALVDTLDRFDPASASATNIVWANLLWVRGPSLGLSATATRLALGRHQSDGDGGVLVRAVDRAVKAAAMVLSAGGFGLVVLDFSDVPSRVIRQLPMTTWLRLQRLVEGRDTVALLIGGEQTTRGPGGVSVGLSRAPGFTARWTGATDRARMLDGFNVRATIARARFRVGDDRAVMFAAAHASPPGTEAAEERYWPPAASRKSREALSPEP